ncbi:MAG: hypothetical protein LQ340_001800 [Diploschistes diacapsis]|nr:MAG: hypothetical protein LQ340_001800 [Diploschistes diacapsis]
MREIKGRSLEEIERLFEGVDVRQAREEEREREKGRGRKEERGYNGGLRILRSILASASLACKLPLKPNFAFNSRTSIFAPALFLRATILLNILAVLAPRRPRQDQALRRQHRDAAAPGVVGAAQDQQPARNCHVRLE